MKPILQELATQKLVSRLDEDTINAIKTAFRVALSPSHAYTSGGQALARIILSCYNGHTPITAPDFRSLAPENYNAVMQLLNVYVRGIYPHKTYDGAEQDMEKLKEKYAHLLSDAQDTVVGGAV